MNSLPWYKRDVDAWRGGTRGMSLEMRGFYSELLDAMWDAQGPLPSDEKRLAMMVCCNVRTVRKLLPQLIAIGKVVETPEGLTNNRMANEIAMANSAKRKPNSVSVEADFEPNSSPIRAEFASKNPKNPMFSTRGLEEEERKKIDIAAQQVDTAKVAVLPFKIFYERLIEAAGSCLTNPVNAQGLLSVAIPQMWIDQGCDLDRDILPTLAAAGTNPKRRNISSWGYFTAMVAQARASRTAGLPALSAVVPANYANAKQIAAKATLENIDRRIAEMTQ